MSCYNNVAQNEAKETFSFHVNLCYFHASRLNLPNNDKYIVQNASLMRCLIFPHNHCLTILGIHVLNLATLLCITNKSCLVNCYF